MVILTILLSEIEVNESIISSIIMFCITLIGVLLIYYFVSTPKEGNNRKENKLINKIIFLVTIIVYFIISFIWKAWAVSWIIFIIGILVAQVIKLIRMLGENQNEKE